MRAIQKSTGLLLMLSAAAGWSSAQDLSTGFEAQVIPEADPRRGNASLHLDSADTPVWLDPSFSQLALVRCPTIDCVGAPQRTVIANFTQGKGGNNLGSARLMLGDDANPFITYSEFQTGSFTSATIRIKSCSDPICSVTPSSLLDALANDLHFAAALNGGNVIDVAYFRHQGTGPSANPIQFATCAIGGSCGASTVSAQAIPYSMTIGGDGAPLIAFVQTFPVSQLMIGKCNDAQCTSFSLQTPIADGNVLALDIAIGPAGLPSVLLDDPGNGLLLLGCGDAACSAVSGLHVLDSLNISTESSYSGGALKFGRDGRPHVTWFDRDFGTAGSLAYSSCNDRLCKTGVVTAHYDDGQFGQGLAPSFAFASNGLPVIGFGTGAGLDDFFVIAKCAKPNCSDEVLFSDGYEL